MLRRGTARELLDFSLMFEIPPGASPSPAVSREKKPFVAPPRVAVTVPGSRGLPRRGLLHSLRAEALTSGLLLMFLVIATAIILFGLAGTIGPWKEGLRDNAPPQTFLGMIAFGAVFLLVTLRITQIVLAEVANRERPRKTGKDMDRGQPWTRDHPWKREGMLPDYTGSPGGMLLGRVAFLAMAGLFNLALGSPSWVLKAVVLLFDLLALLVLWDSLVKIWHWLRYRQPTISWRTFPAFLGERLEATVEFPRALRPSGAAVATLRCARDERVARRPDAEGNRLEPELRPFSLYTQSGKIPLAAGPLDRLDLAFPLPKDAPETNLGIPEATYWQILLTIPTSGPDFETVFLAPVYRRS